LQWVHLLGISSASDKTAQLLQYQSQQHLNQTKRAAVQKSEETEHQTTLTSEDGEFINRTEMPASPMQCLKAVPPKNPAASATAGECLTLCSPGHFRKPGNKMEILKGADETWELGLLLGVWEPGDPECGEPHSPPPLGSSPAFLDFCSTGNWSLLLHLCYKIEDFVKLSFLSEKSWQKIPCRELSCALRYYAFSVCLLSLTSRPLE